MNPQQQEGIRTVDGPVLLLAGAGSGKTRVVTHRIAYLIEERGVPADSILAVTFTNKAAKEMEERVDKILGHSSLAKPLLATFHSFCVRVLRRDIEALRVNGVGLTKSFAIYDEQDQQAVVKSALKRLGIDDKSLKPRVALGRISWAKNHMIDPQEYFLASTNPIEEKIAHIFEIYRKELAKANAMDFDDLLLETVRLFKSSTEVRERYNRRYRYVMIDEYQDTNRPQYELMKLLAGPEKNVCVVGDEDQSIYSWRGADIKNILDFEKDFPNGKTIRLEQNYRSTQVILEGASTVVAQNTQRKGKNLWTSREGGSLIGYYEAPDGENEALFVADRIRIYLREAGQQQDEPRCAVLYRTNSQSRLIEEALRRYQIQYHMVGGFSFYDRAEVKDLLSYLKLVMNPHDSIALQRVVNSPARGIGKTTMETLERMALSSGMSTWDSMARAMEDRLLPQRTINALEGFRRLIDDARAMLGPGFAEKLAGDVDEAADEDEAIAASDDTSFDVSEFAGEAGDDTNDIEEPDQDDAQEFDTSFNFAFNFGPSEEISTIAAENAQDSDEQHGIDAVSFNPFAPVVLKTNSSPRERGGRKADPSTPLRSGRDDTSVISGGRPISSQQDVSPLERSTSPADRPAFRSPGGKATLPEIIKFINERSGYIRSLEDEGTPEAFSRIENLKELANAAQDAEERGETLDEFLDHAALASDADQYSAEAKVTLMTLHAAKGLEFPLVFLTGMEEGLFPSARTMMDPTGLEEERRLCYVGMTRAMDTLVMTRARYRRRYGNDSPEASVASRFLEEVPSRLVEDLGSPPARPQFSGDYSNLYSTPYPKANRFGRPGEREEGDRHWSYEDEDQSGEGRPSASRQQRGGGWPTAGGSGSLDNIASFFAARGQRPPTKGASRPKVDVPEPTGKTGLRQGTRVRHPKYGEGTVFRREGDGDDAKITVQFQQHGVKKLVEKFAQLERL
jgi:DNA helicase II / ATP-dependent DNA helicase PcrA